MASPVERGEWLRPKNSLRPLARKPARWMDGSSPIPVLSSIKREDERERERKEIEDAPADPILPTAPSLSYQSQGWMLMNRCWWTLPR